MFADNLVKLLDSLTETGIFVIEEKSRCLLYYNKHSKENGLVKASPGIRCDKVWPDVCTGALFEGLEESGHNHIICYDSIQDTTVYVTAARTVWDGSIPAVVVTVMPHRPDFEKDQGLQKAGQIYAKSLVTVFDECIIANLTADYYVNCQKDALWTDVPEQGKFDEESRRYAANVIHPEDLQSFLGNFSRDALLRHFEEGKRHVSRRIRRLTADGTYHMVEFYAARIGRLAQEDCWCVLVYRDIQEEYLREMRRGVELEQLAAAAKSAYQMLISINLSQNSYHMLEYERFPVEGPEEEGAFSDLIEFEVDTVHPDYREEFLKKFRIEALTEAFTGGKRIVEMQVPHRGTDGVYHWYFTQVVRVKSPYGDDLEEITLSRNIDGERQLQQLNLEKERKAKQLLEDALQKAEKASQAKSDFLSRMSHDIRTPMNAIVGMTELAQQNMGNEEKLKDYLEKIAASGKHLLGLINEVLDVSRIESGTFSLVEREFDLRNVVQEAVEMIRLSLDKKEQQLTVQIEEDLHPRVIGDAMHLKQVLVNILENASKYTGEGGRISLTLEELKKEELHADTYRFVIADNGIGMKPEYLEHIFEPFSRAEDSRISRIMGTGLGMTIVKNIVSMMNGDIQVESEYGKGSRFRITLCLPKCGVGISAAEERGGEEETFEDMRILLAEDNEFNRQIAREMLQLMGAQVEEAEDGSEAVKAVCSHPPLYYDMVFMDIRMPVMNGYEASEKIRASGMEFIDELPIIALTADAFAEDVKQAQLAGMDGHIAKPISMEQLRRALSRCRDWKKKKKRKRIDIWDDNR